MNNVQLFNNEEFGQVRVVIQDGEPWFILADICRVLEIANPSDVKTRLDSDEVMTLGFTEAHSGKRGGAQSATAVNESALYKVIFRSNKPTAKQFTKWVTSEVLPVIRKTGSYGIQNVEDILSNPDTMIKILTEYKKEKEARVAAEAKIALDAPKVNLANAITSSVNSILVRDLAKILSQNGWNTGEKRLYKTLREMGYLIKKKGMDYNRPTQFSMDRGLFEVRETTIENRDGSILTKFTTMVTGKGQEYFVNKFKEWAGIED